MNKDLNHECIICGRKYHSCDSCKKMEHSFSSWRTICDTHNHYQIYMVIRDYRAGAVSLKAAREMLGQIGIHTLADIGPVKASAEAILSLILCTKNILSDAETAGT